MPLTDDIWAKGKCGFKALQYMALQIPAVVSPVGVNTEIIDSGVNGFLCSSEEEWFNAIDKLIKDESLRLRVGAAGRKKVMERYSVLSNSSTFLSLFS
jgi:glycosyltransferase involved in cell wall biosynthesis